MRPINGVRLRELRFNLAMSTRELARRADVAPSTIAGLEKGVGGQSLTLGQLFKLASALQVQPRDLLEAEAAGSNDDNELRTEQRPSSAARMLGHLLAHGEVSWTFARRATNTTDIGLRTALDQLDKHLRLVGIRAAADAKEVRLHPESASLHEDEPLLSRSKIARTYPIDVVRLVYALRTGELAHPDKPSAPYRAGLALLTRARIIEETIEGDGAPYVRTRRPRHFTDDAISVADLIEIADQEAELPVWQTGRRRQTSQRTNALGTTAEIRRWAKQNGYEVADRACLSQTIIDAWLERSTSTFDVTTVDKATIRAWAKARGLPVKVKGAISDSVVTAYAEAHRSAGTA